jgi:hypothetical protein
VKEMAQVVMHLPNKSEALSSICSTAKKKKKEEQKIHTCPTCPGTDGVGSDLNDICLFVYLSIDKLLLVKTRNIRMPVNFQRHWLNLCQILLGSGD